MKVSSNTLTALAILTNPLVWLCVCLAVAFGVLYVMYLYIKVECSLHPRTLVVQLPTLKPRQEWTTSGTPETAATLKPSDEWATSGTPECKVCGIALEGRDCPVCGAEDKGAVAVPSGLVAQTLATEDLPLAQPAPKRPRTRPVLALAAQTGNDKAVKTPKKTRKKNRKPRNS